MRYSIIIPALNEAELVARAIRSLQNLKTFRGEYEIIVVDNNSTDNTFRMAKEAGADIVVRELVQGTGFARQRGVLESSGKIIVCLDADCEAPPDWLTHIESNLSRKGVVATSGPYKHGFKGIRRICEIFYMHHVMRLFPEFLRLVFGRKIGMINGGNFAAKRSAIDEIGGFPPIVFYGDDPATGALLSRFVGDVFYDRHLVVNTSPRRYAGNFLKPAIKTGSVFIKVYFSKEYNKKPLQA